MTEKVSEPMRLRMASRASCISSLRSSESVSVISLPCEYDDLALGAVRITDLYFDGYAGRKCVLWHAREKRGAVVATRLGGIGSFSYDHLYTLLHAGPVDNEFLVLSLVG